MKKITTKIAQHLQVTKMNENKSKEDENTAERTIIFKKYIRLLMTTPKTHFMRSERSKALNSTDIFAIIDRWTPARFNINTISSTPSVLMSVENSKTVFGNEFVVTIKYFKERTFKLFFKSLYTFRHIKYRKVHKNIEWSTLGIIEHVLLWIRFGKLNGVREFIPNKKKQMKYFLNKHFDAIIFFNSNIFYYLLNMRKTLQWNYTDFNYQPIRSTWNDTNLNFRNPYVEMMYVSVQWFGVDESWIIIYSNPT